MVVNVHSVVLPVPAERAGALIDTLGSNHDVLWPGDRWPLVTRAVLAVGGTPTAKTWSRWLRLLRRLG